MVEPVDFRKFLTAVAKELPSLVVSDEGVESDGWRGLILRDGMMDLWTSPDGAILDWMDSSLEFIQPHLEHAAKLHGFRKYTYRTHLPLLEGEEDDSYSIYGSIVTSFVSYASLSKGDVKYVAKTRDTSMGSSTHSAAYAMVWTKAVLGGWGENSNA